MHCAVLYEYELPVPIADSCQDLFPCVALRWGYTLDCQRQSQYECKGLVCLHSTSDINFKIIANQGALSFEHMICMLGRMYAIQAVAPVSSRARGTMSIARWAVMHLLLIELFYFKASRLFQNKI